MATHQPATSWADAGFSHPPDEKEAVGGEEIYRAYGGSSEKMGNCFFAPAVADSPIGYWTAELLERELNAALWGNDFEGVTKFRMLPGAKYQIGGIAHEDYEGQEKGGRFYQRAFFTPSGIFKQVKFILTRQRGLESCVRELSEFPLKAGRYAREASRRAQRIRNQ